MLRENDLPKLNVPGAKGPGAVKQVVFPHAVEPLAVFRFQLTHRIQTIFLAYAGKKL
jgi:hypothetical protein